MLRADRFALVAILAVTSACASTQVPPPDPPHHHELHLPPVGPSVRVTLDGKTAEVVLATVPHDGATASLTQVWKSAFPAEDAGTLHFDMVSSDGFHPASRPKCARPLTGAELATAHIDVVTHDVTFDAGMDLPGCYKVRAIVILDATR